MEGNANYGGNGRSCSSTNSRLAGKRKRGSDNSAAASTQLQAGESSTASTPALLNPGAQSSSSTELAGEEQSSQSHFHVGNVNAFTAVESNTIALVSNNVGPIGASDAVPEMDESAVQGDSNSFHAQTPEQIGVLTLNMQAWQGQGIRILQLLLFQAYAVQMETFENPDPDGLTELINAAIEVHLKPRKYRRLTVSEDEQCGICLDEIVCCRSGFLHACISPQVHQAVAFAEEQLPILQR